MERREGPQYDFCGPLLKDLLVSLSGSKKSVKIAISMLFCGRRDPEFHIDFTAFGIVYASTDSARSRVTA